MLTKMEEVKAVKQMINGVDSADLLSVDSTEPIETELDTVEPEKKEDNEEKPGAPKEEQEEKEDEGEEETKEEDTEKENEEPPTEPAKPAKGVEKRIAELTKRWRTAERERDFERSKRVEAEKKLSEALSKLPSSDRPKKEDFDDEDDYLEALTDWKIEEKLRAAQLKAVESSESAEEAANVAGAYGDLDKAIDQGRKKYDDFDELVLDENLTLTTEMLNTILLSDIASDIMYHLAKNPEIAEDISKMSEVKAAKEIGKIEAALEKVKEEPTPEPTPKPQPKPKPKTSKAPEPIKPVDSGGSVEKDPSKMSMAEYRAWREQNK